MVLGAVVEGCVTAAYWLPPDAWAQTAIWNGFWSLEVGPRRCVLAPASGKLSPPGPWNTILAAAEHHNARRDWGGPATGRPDRRT